MIASLHHLPSQHTADYHSYIADHGALPRLKDMAGIGRPEMLGQLVKTSKINILKSLKQYHGHSGPNIYGIYFEVCENGADIIDVAMGPYHGENAS